MNKVGNFRWVVCALIFFSVAINYIDRLIIGILKGPLSEQLGWSDSDGRWLDFAASSCAA